MVDTATAGVLAVPLGVSEVVAKVVVPAVPHGVSEVVAKVVVVVT